jgi:hypothetical protein
MSLFLQPVLKLKLKLWDKRANIRSQTRSALSPDCMLEHQDSSLHFINVSV